MKPQPPKASIGLTVEDYQLMTDRLFDRTAKLVSIAWGLAVAVFGLGVWVASTSFQINAQRESYAVLYSQVEKLKDSDRTQDNTIQRMAGDVSYLTRREQLREQNEINREVRKP